jgi:acetyl-CoA carboxylase biotin carboxylase subunit
MGKAAVEGARAVDYRGVGTIEFLVDDDLNFYFMEMNTRIQVEHPITEEAYEVDLVQDQIRVALGEKLTYKQEDIRPRWASIECRINAEDVEKDFRPTPGTISAIHVPGGPGVRVDKAVYADYAIPPYYDSMIAKLIVRARTRPEAVIKMRHALSEFVVQGIPTTVEFHQAIFEHPDFIAGKYDTSFIETRFKGNQETTKAETGDAEEADRTEDSKDSRDGKSMTITRPEETGESTPTSPVEEEVTVTSENKSD